MGDDAQIYLVHTAMTPEELAAVPGVEEVQELTDGLALVVTELSRSKLYHQVKWAGPPKTPVVVVRLHEQPKASRVAPGAVGWLRERLPKRLSPRPR